MQKNVRIVKGMVFPVVMYRRESWPIKKAEHQKTDAFKLWFWRRLFRVPWTARRSNQSILKEIYSEFSLEGLMLKLKLQYFGYLMGRMDSFEKILMQGKIEGGMIWENGTETCILSYVKQIARPGLTHDTGCSGLTARRSNQSILKEISPEYSLEGLMLKLKLQYFGYLM